MVSRSLFLRQTNAYAYIMTQFIKEEPVDSVVPPQEATSSSAVSRRSPQPQRRSAGVEIILPTKRQLYGTNPPSFENASRFIAEKNLVTSVVKKEEENLLVSLPFVVFLSLYRAVPSHTIF